MKNQLYIAIVLLFSTLSLVGQGLVEQQLKSQNENHEIGCGSYQLLIDADKNQPGFLEQSNEALKAIVRNSSVKRKKADELIEIEVVFHIVYNTPEENIPDEVIAKQMEVLNAAFRRTNADTSDMRLAFAPYVGDSKIEFKLASSDPTGQPTSGIVRKSTTIENFGGTLPYGPNESQKSAKWVADSFYINLGRLSSTANGGSDAWDQDRYLNIWVGDLRLFEPKYGNLKELVFLGLATPPNNHGNFREEPSIDEIFGALSDGVFMHSPVLGPDNPYKIEAPYNAFNDLATAGKMLVHEVGHYLGLRHTWGDGLCDKDDYIDDTPLSNNSSQYQCAKARNSCVDDIDGVDLPDMVENYMDYSGDACMNSFTTGQIAVMREVALLGRQNFVSVNPIEVNDIKIYPNPTTGRVTIQSGIQSSIGDYKIVNLQGEVVHQGHSLDHKIELDLLVSSGIYFIEVLSKGTKQVKRISIWR